MKPLLHSSRALARLAVALAAMAFLGCRHEADKSAAEEPKPKIDGDTITFAADSPQKSALAVEQVQPLKKRSVYATGRLSWDEESTVRIFAPVAGRVDRVNVAVGQKVSANDTLATLASPDFGQAQSDASRAAADLKLSERTLARLQDLFAHGAAAKKDVEAAEDDLAGKQAENARAQARLKLYGAAVGAVDGLYSLKAPLGGVVVDKTINPGQEVRPDQMLANAPQLFAPLFVVSDPEKLSVQLDVTELEIGMIKAGQTLRVQTKAYPGKVFSGRLELVGGSLDPLTRVVKVRGSVDNREGLLRAEMYVSVDIDDENMASSHDSPSLEIPVSAVFSKDAKHFVFIEQSAGAYRRQAVEVGSEHDGKICVNSGLAPGQRVVSSGCLLLQSMTEAAKE